MADLNKLLTPLFLNEKEIRKIIELMFFSYRDFTSGPDKVLEKINFGRAHHRVIYFVGKKNNLTIKELLTILQITKQSLSRVLNQLVKEKYIILSIGDDKRTKKLILSKKGQELEKKLSDKKIKKIQKIIKNFEEREINSFKKVLYEMIEKENQKREFKITALVPILKKTQFEFQLQKIVEVGVKDIICYISAKTKDQYNLEKEIDIFRNNL